VDNLRRFASDDEDDTLLFDKMQEYVLEHYPNPQRIGCLDRATPALLLLHPARWTFPIRSTFTFSDAQNAPAISSNFVANEKRTYSKLLSAMVDHSF
jgi:hypothetical protein